MTDDEGRLREAFHAQRAVERAGAPGFHRVLAGRRVAGYPVFALPALGAALIAVLLILSISFRRSRTLRAELEVARQVMSWHGPTDFLLPEPLPGLGFPAPRIDESPAGSPLKALDRGGALGSPITPRRPRS